MIFCSTANAATTAWRSSASFAWPRFFREEEIQPTATASSSSRSKSKPAPAQPAKGTSSLLSFFTRSTPVASASSPVNPVKVVANNRRVQPLDAGKGKENAQRAASPKRTSKFFGGGGGTSASLDKGKGMEGEVDVEPEVEGEQDESHLLGDEDNNAEAALRDVEMTAIVTTTITTTAMQVDSVNRAAAAAAHAPHPSGSGTTPLPGGARGTVAGGLSPKSLSLRNLPFPKLAASASSSTFAAGSVVTAAAVGEAGNGTTTDDGGNSGDEALAKGAPTPAAGAGARGLKIKLGGATAEAADGGAGAVAPAKGAAAGEKLNEKDKEAGRKLRDVADPARLSDAVLPP
ncbi:hypothetical protein JCM1840_007433 [Sporobolomyces johnsonii]